MPSRRVRLVLAAAAASITLSPLVVTATAAPSELASSSGVAVRNGAGPSLALVRSAGASAARAKSGNNGISYHGGPVITGPTKVYYIWYGSSSASTVDVLTSLAQNIGGSAYYNINTGYYNGANVHVSNAVTYVSAVTTTTYKGTSLSDAAIQGVVADAIINNQLPKDVNALYFVLTAPGVTASSGFLTKYCGWHTHATIASADIKYSFVGNPNGSSSCLQQTAGSPNGDVNADGMASVLAHELEETATDPDLNAWYDTRGYENADKCAWTFGTTYGAGGGIANVHLGSRDYLIQRNWVNASGGYCSMS